MDESVRHGNPNPLLTANLFSKLSFWWLSALLKKGSKGWLEESDMYNVCPIDSSEDSGAKLEAAWNKELEQQKKGKQPSFLRALFRTFGAQYLPFLFLGLFEELVRIGQPLLLAQLLDYFTTDSTTSKSEAWLYATGLVLCFITQTISHHTLFFATTRIGMRVRVSSCSLIYRKSLRLSNKSLTECSVGQIVNMMSNDVAKYDTGMMFFLYLVVGPIQCLAAVIYLWYLLGPAVLAALMLMILLMPAQIIYGKLLFNRRQKFVVHTDRRVKVMNEIISGVRIIKLYCWEKPFGSIVEILRRLEIKHLRRIRHVQCFHIGPYYAMAQFSIFFFILVLVLIGRERDIDPGTVFMLLGMLETFRLSLGMFIPVAASSLAEVLVVVSRMQKFLLLEEISKVTDSKLPQACVEKSVIDMGYKNRPGYSVKITNLTAKWDTVGETADTLENVSLTLEHGRFVAVIGPVGAGKTSLLMSILGELPPRTGAVDARGKIAFVSQHPWIFSGSLRQNILFGEKMDTPRYDKIIKICALSRDLSILPKGDATLIGDRGVNLSGGQKARVSLARALYMDADVYLLDDPLAAVDTTVGKHIFHKCIMGYLENKPRILVTHQIQLLPNADNIVILTNGQIMSQGTYTELSKSGVDFSELLKPPEEDSAEKDGYNQKVIDYQNQSKSSEVKDKRRLSVISQDSVGDAYVPDSVQLPEEEERETGSIDREVFLAYFKAAAHIPLFVAMSISFIAAQVAYVGSYWWLARWTDATADRDSALNAQNQNRTDMGRTLNYTHTHIPEVDTYFNLYIYIGIIIALFILFLGRAFLFFEFAVKAGENLHNMIFVRILRTAMVFFDTNPVGRILNRFSKDTGQIDDLLPWSMFDCFQSGLSCASIVIVACIVNPWVFIPVIPLMVVFVIVRNYYAKTSRSVK